MKRIIILGTGGNCVDILDTLDDLNDAHGAREYECAGFLDDDPERRGFSHRGVAVVGTLADAVRFAGCRFVFGVGSTRNFWRREHILARTGIPGNRFETVIHPTASVSRTAKVGLGTVIFQNATITSNVEIGSHVLVLPNSVVSHDSRVGDFTCIAGGVCISGGVTVGRQCYIGSNATIMERLTVGDGALVGMGAVVRYPVESGTVVVGNPARFLRRVGDRTGD